MSFLNDRRIKCSRERVLKFPMIVDLTSSPNSSVNVCFVQFEAVLLDTAMD